MCHDAHTDAGFTLVEVLVVLAILGLAIGMVVINLPKAPPTAATQIRTLVAKTHIAQEAAILRGQPTALGLSDTGYHFYDYDSAWVMRGGETALDGRLKLSIEGEVVTLEDALSAPQIIFDPTGDVTDFDLRLDAVSGTYHLRPNARGAVEWVTP